MLSCPSSVRVFEHVKRTEVIITCSMKLINKQARGTWPHFSCSSSTKERGEGGAGRMGGGGGGMQGGGGGGGGRKRVTGEGESRWGGVERRE